MYFFSVLSQIIGVISEIPISLDFSKNHSNLSIDLSGDMAICKPYGRLEFLVAVFMSTLQ